MMNQRLKEGTRAFKIATMIHLDLGKSSKQPLGFCGEETPHPKSANCGPEGDGSYVPVLFLCSCLGDVKNRGTRLPGRSVSTL